jgi:two-component system sensor histidine kinase ChvG
MRLHSVRFRPAPILRLTRRRLRTISPLTVRILAVNLMALAIPITGTLFLAQYQQRLISNELASMRTDASLYAVAIAEGCATTDQDDNPIILPTLARQMIRHLTRTALTRSQLFDTNEKLIADSHQLMGPGGVVQLEELPPLHPHHDLGDDAMQRLGEVLDEIPGRRHIPRMPKDGIMDPAVLESMRQALDGNLDTRVWRTATGGLVFVAAAPVQNLESVLGAVMIVHDGHEIDSAIGSLRLDMLKVSGFALAITTILSIYLARKISSPIRKLAAAAIAQTQDLGQGRRIEIPDFSLRRDEIGDLSAAMRQMTEALWERMDAIDRFAADVAHELKNPLTSLRSAVETMERVEDHGQKARLMEIVGEDLRRMDRLITDISSASRLDAELSRIEPVPVDLRQLIHMAVDLNPVNDGGKRVVFNPAPQERPCVLGTESRLMQVMQNLIENALSFSPEGGLVQIGLRSLEDHVEVTIEDDGPGIPEGKLEEIFDRFYTERPAGEAFGTHSGLGLSISKQIVEAHLGEIFAENRMNDIGGIIGARFTLYLPRAKWPV